MTKVCMIGAGSTVFMKNLVGDILLNEIFADCEIALQDIDEDRLKTSAVVAGKIADTLSVSPRITATTDRREALEGAGVAVEHVDVRHLLVEPPAEGAHRDDRQPRRRVALPLAQPRQALLEVVAVLLGLPRDRHAARRVELRHVVAQRVEVAGERLVKTPRVDERRRPEQARQIWLGAGAIPTCRLFRRRLQRRSRGGLARAVAFAAVRGRREPGLRRRRGDDGAAAGRDSARC